MSAAAAATPNSHHPSRVQPQPPPEDVRQSTQQQHPRLADTTAPTPPVFNL